jgi:hypothetical protein
LDFLVRNGLAANELAPAGLRKKTWKASTTTKTHNVFSIALISSFDSVRSGRALRIGCLCIAASVLGRFKRAANFARFISGNLDAHVSHNPLLSQGLHTPHAISSNIHDASAFDLEVIELTLGLPGEVRREQAF